jgi:hypothetical protein
LIITIIAIGNAAAGLHDDGKTGGILNSWGQYAKSGDIIFDVAGGLGGGVALRASITCLSLAPLKTLAPPFSGSVVSFS